MWLMYVDDSGDSGLWTPEKGKQGTTDYYALSGLIISEHNWKEYLDNLKALRKRIREDKSFRIPVTTQLKGRWLIKSSDRKEYYPHIQGRKDAVELYKFLLESFSIIFSTSKIINVFFDKVKLYNQQQKKDIFSSTWNRLIQRYHNFLRSVEGERSSLGIILTDNTHGGKLNKLIRKMRRYNPIPSKFSNSYYQDLTTTIIEDCVERHSKDSYFIQVADLIVYALQLHVRKKRRNLNLDRVFLLLKDQFLKVATSNDPEGLGIVRLP